MTEPEFLKLIQYMQDLIQIPETHAPIQNRIINSVYRSDFRA